MRPRPTENADLISRKFSAVLSVRKLTWIASRGA
jgi:hypothetical protein